MQKHIALTIDEYARLAEARRRLITEYGRNFRFGQVIALLATNQVDNLASLVQNKSQEVENGREGDNSETIRTVVVGDTIYQNDIDE